MHYPDRRAAGRALALSLRHYERDPGALVLALPRGGVPVGAEIARALELPLDVFIVRKLGVPGHEELAFGAIASGDVIVFNEDVVRKLGLSPAIKDEVARREIEELDRRERLYRQDRPPQQLEGRNVILVDDGLATGATMRAAVAAVRQRNAARVVVAVPVAAPTTCAALIPEVDELVCPLRPREFDAVGQWYLDFSQTSDEEVQKALAPSR